MANYNDVIELVGESQIVLDEYDNQVAIPAEPRKVYANRWRDGERGKTAVTGKLSESAGIIDTRDVRRYEVRTADYNYERIAYLDGKKDEWEIAHSWRGDSTLLEMRRKVI